MNKKIDIDYAAVKSLPDLLCLLREKGVPENLLWRYVDTYQERKAREKGIPLYGQFELTPLCNLDCKMCYVHLNKEQLGGASVLSVEQWKDIMSQAHAMGMMHASLTGGECLTYPGFDELYMFLRSLGVKISIKTNGILLNDQQIAFFNKYPPRGITVSLYGSSNQAYQNVTGHAAFDAVYASLLRLKKVEYPVSIAVTPSRYMYDDMEGIISLVKQLDFPWSINVALFQPRKETGRELCDLSWFEYVEILKKIRGNSSSSAIPVEETELPECSKNGDPRFGITCGAGRSSFTVTWDAKMVACDNLNSLRSSLLDKSFSVAWDEIHEDALSYPLPVECNRCPYDKVCFGCAAYRSNGMKLGHCNPKICERTRLLVKEGIYSM